MRVALQGFRYQTTDCALFLPASLLPSTSLSIRYTYTRSRTRSQISHLNSSSFITLRYMRRRSQAYIVLFFICLWAFMTSSSTKWCLRTCSPGRQNKCTRRYENFLARKISRNTKYEMKGNVNYFKDLRLSNLRECAQVKQRYR